MRPSFDTIVIDPGSITIEKDGPPLHRAASQGHRCPIAGSGLSPQRGGGYFLMAANYGGRHERKYATTCGHKHCGDIEAALSPPHSGERQAAR